MSRSNANKSDSYSCLKENSGVFFLPYRHQIRSDQAGFWCTIGQETGLHSVKDYFADSAFPEIKEILKEERPTHFAPISPVDISKHIIIFV